LNPEPGPTPGNILPVDFRQPALLTAAEQRKLRLRHDDFTRSLGTRLSIYLRLDVSVAVSELHTLPQCRFTESLSTPTHLVFFKAESLPESGILQIPPCFGLAVIERLLGGAGEPAEPRELTDIETAVLHQYAMVVLKEWCQCVAHLPETAAGIMGHETNPAFVQTTRERNVLVLKLEARMGEHSAPMQLALPYAMLDPIVRQFKAGLSRVEPAPSMQAVQWNPALDSVPIGITAEWQGLEVPARQLANLMVGDVLPAGDPSAIEVRFASVLRFVGRLGASGNKRAIELVKTVASAAAC
jgi:flagellar motor switch protein FliM